MFKSWLAVVFLFIVLLSTQCATVQAAYALPAVAENSGEFALGGYYVYNPIADTGSMTGLACTYYASNGLFLQANAGFGWYGDSSAFEIAAGYNHTREESFEYFVAGGADYYLENGIGTACNPIIFVGYRSNRVGLGPIGEYIELGNTWHGGYLGYAFKNLLDTGDPSLGNAIFFGYTFEFRF